MEVLQVMVAVEAAMWWDNSASVTILMMMFGRSAKMNLVQRMCNIYSTALTLV